MEITFNIPRSEKRWLSDLPYGRMFMFPSGQAVYIKVNDCLLPEGRYGSVSLGTGNYYKSEDKSIIQVDGILTVNEIIRG